MALELRMVLHFLRLMREREGGYTHTPKQNKNQGYSNELQITCPQRLEFLFAGPFRGGLAEFSLI